MTKTIDLPYVVTDSKNVAVGEQTPVLERFATEREAAEYISTLPEHLTGRYGLCGPSDDEPFLHESITPHVATTFELGAIVTCSWGYNQTNIEFFCIIARNETPTGQVFLKLQPMTEAVTERTGDMTENVVAGVMDESAEAIRRKLYKDENGTEIGCRYNESYGWIGLWGGKPRYQSHYA